MSPATGGQPRTNGATLPPVGTAKTLSFIATVCRLVVHTGLDRESHQVDPKVAAGSSSAVRTIAILSGDLRRCVAMKITIRAKWVGTLFMKPLDRKPYSLLTEIS